MGKTPKFSKLYPRFAKNLAFLLKSSQIFVRIAYTLSIVSWILTVFAEGVIVDLTHSLSVNNSKGPW